VSSSHMVMTIHSDSDNNFVHDSGSVMAGPMSPFEVEIGGGLTGSSAH
jgi:hypothetical protein